ncbi:hypothetical protein AN690_0221015 [Citrobacter freundii]|nr:hypothetical protein AN688_0218845 [Citrobacter freundii]OEH20747.1 hypothetical protein AN690_0221015 [Citrobacter freundii]
MKPYFSDFIPQIIYGVKLGFLQVEKYSPHDEVCSKLKLLSGNGDLLFPGAHDAHKPMSENTINKALRTMGYDTQVDMASVR